MIGFLKKLPALPILFGFGSFEFLISIIVFLSSKIDIFFHLNLLDLYNLN